MLVIGAGRAVVDPIGALLVAALVVYEVGRRRLVAAGGDGRSAVVIEHQAWLFRLGVLVGAGVLFSPLRVIASDQLFARALIDVALAWVVAPLVVLGAPANAFVAAIRPVRVLELQRYERLRAERSEWGGDVVPRWPIPGQPVTGVAVLLLSVWLWHIPVILDATVHDIGLQSLVFVSYLSGGVLWWMEMVGSHPYRPRLSHLARAVLVVAAFAGYWGLGAAMVYSQRSWYPAFLEGASAVLPGVMGQDYAGAFFWGLPSIPLGVASFWVFARWLEGENAEEDRLARYLSRAGLSSPDGPARNGPPS